MAGDSGFREFPPRVRVSLEQRDVYYVVVPGWFAMHEGRVATAGTARAFRFDDEGITVYRGIVPRGQVARHASPVYAIPPRGAPAVPTGRVFVRFAQEIPAESRRDDLARAGYEIREVPPYAPHAAWVFAASGGLAVSLVGIGRLEELADVVNVEPQMLRIAGRR